MDLPSEGFDPMPHHNSNLLYRKCIIPFLLARLELLPNYYEHLFSVYPQLRDFGGWEVLIGVDGCRVFSEGFGAVDWNCRFLCCCFGDDFFDKLGEVFADLPQHSLVLLDVLSDRPV